MRPLQRAVLASASGLAVAAPLAACAKPADTGPAAADAAAVAVEVTDAGCRPTPASVAAGPVTFNVTNKNSGKVTETELKQNDTIIGEKENLTPGLSGDFSLKLKAGKYTVYCPNAGKEEWEFTVTGNAADSSLAPGVKTALDQATDGYRQ